MEKPTFTEQERMTIDDIHRRNFENLTSDEVALLLRWNTAQTEFKTRLSDESKRRDEYLQQKIENAKQELDYRLGILNEKAQIARQRLERVENEQH